MGGARLGVDIGGTFTDVALEVGEKRYTSKLLTTTDAPEKGVLAAIASALEEAKLEAAALEMIIHGTTLATNVLIERKGPRTALVTTEGFRDVIEIRHENRFEQYDIDIDLPPPLVPRRWRFGVKERVDAQGKVLVPLDEAALGHVIDRLARERIASVAIGFLHSFTNPSHERRAQALIAERLPGVTVTLSSEVSPEMREYERFSTACANAYVQPLIGRYLRNLEEGLRRAGARCPLYLISSGGGLTTVETAIRFPVRLVESGPAGGAIFACHIAAQCGLDKVISFDMGGTTAKICLIDDAKPQTNRVFEVARIYRFKKGSGIPLRIPVIEMVEIGAGGGSIARVDAMGRIAVGPDSAGAEPGPACYGRGGAEPTVTDADLVLGRIDPAAFSGGKIRLDAPAADGAVTRGIGERLGLTAEFAALGISEMVDENMANAARVHTIESGKNVAERTLVAFGGAAPLHAARVAEKLGLDRVLVPTNAGVGSAIGFLRAPIAFEIVRSHMQRLSHFDAVAANRVLGEMRREAEAIVRRGAGSEVELEERRSAFMRYRGQGHEISVPLPARDFTQADTPLLLEAFEAAYRGLYSRAIPGVDIEILSWVMVVSAPFVASEEAPQPLETGVGKPVSRRKVFDPASGEFLEVPFYRRETLRPGWTVEGPAVIEEDETSTVISPAFSARVDGFGYIELRRRGE
ncbi:MAG TPA: hydantoinase/oxoprolinase family protein [Alphaproteobacteria bacterium]|nr:hydantoinase/oxoprolinase family protein [Alphaproteobacteria bacterium]